MSSFRGSLSGDPTFIGHKTTFDTVVKVLGDRVQMTMDPEDVLFLET